MTHKSKPIGSHGWTVDPSLPSRIADVLDGATVESSGALHGHFVECLLTCPSVKDAFNLASDSIDREARDKRNDAAQIPQKRPWNELSIKVQKVEAKRIVGEFLKTMIEGIFLAIKPATMAGRIAAAGAKEALKQLIDQDLESGLENFVRDVAKEVVGEWIGEFLPADTIDVIDNLADEKVKDLGQRITDEVVKAIQEAEKNGDVSFTISREEKFAAFTVRENAANVPGLGREECCYRTVMVWNYTFREGERDVLEFCRVNALYCIDKKEKVVKTPLTLSGLSCSRRVKEE